MDDLRASEPRPPAGEQQRSVQTSQLSGKTSRAKFLRFLAIPAICGGLFLLSSGDSQDHQSVSAAPPIVRQKTQPFNKDWLEIHWMIRQKCNGCHRPDTDRHDFSTYESVLGDGPSGELIVPGRPDESLLWQYVNWNHNADPASDAPDTPMMPPDPADERLTAGQLQTVRRWIESGALEYELPVTCNTRPILETDFVSAKECAVCHPKQYDEWSRSMHAYAQHSPVFEAFNLTLLERTGGTISTFCSRCHTPVGTSLGEPGGMRNVHRSRISMEGVSCVVCHRLSKPFYKSSGRLPVTPGKLQDGCFFGPFTDPVDINGSTHRAAGAAHLTKAEMCGTCHDVTNPQGVRLEEAFSEWQNSPAAKEGITCHDCHMGPNPGVPVKPWQRPIGKAASVPGIDPGLLPDRHLSNHSFAGPDYSLLPDTEFPYKLDWMYETDYRNIQNLTDYQRRTLTQLRVRNRMQLAKARELRLQLLRNAAYLSVSHPEQEKAGGRFNLHVEVTSTTAGHNFPTGFTSERQVWIEAIVTDPSGGVVFVSGDLDANGDLRDEHSYNLESGKIAWDKYLINFQSKFTILSTRGTERPVILPVNRDLTPINVIRPSTEAAQSFGRPTQLRVSRASLPPLGTRGQHYPVKLPDCAGTYRVTVRLNFRHLPPVLLDKIGIPHLKHLLETVVIDEYHGVIQVE